MKLKNLFFIALLVLTWSPARTAQADLVLSVTPSAATYNAGDTGFLDVMIYSDAGDALGRCGAPALRGRLLVGT